MINCMPSDEENNSDMEIEGDQEGAERKSVKRSGRGGEAESDGNSSDEDDDEVTGRKVIYGASLHYL